MAKSCLVKTCDKKAKARGWCNSHYNKWLRNGDPLRGRGYDERHGMSGTPEYRIWISMISRCHNENNPAYEYYGERGIKVCESWRNSFTNFINDVGRRPNSKLTLERIDNSLGYRPDNCEWATRAAQSYNQRASKRNKSGLAGVWFDGVRDKWQAYISVENKYIHLGRFKNKQLAMNARREAELNYYGRAK